MTETDKKKIKAQVKKQMNLEKDSAYSSCDKFSDKLVHKPKENLLEDDEVSNRSSVKSALRNAYNLGIEAETTIHQRIIDENVDDMEAGSARESKRKIKSKQLPIFIVSYEEIAEVEEEIFVIFRCKSYLKVHLESKI